MTQVLSLVRPLHTPQVALPSGRCYLLQYAGITSAGRERASGFWRGESSLPAML